MKKEDREKIRTGEKDILHPDFTESRGEIIEPERISGAEILPESIEFEGLPPDIMERCENAFSDFCIYECKPPIEDMRKEKQLVFVAACQYIGLKVNRPIIYPRQRGEGGRWERINESMVYSLIDVFRFFCAKYGKIPTIYGFCSFCGFSSAWIFEDREEIVTPERVKIWEKCRRLEFVGIKEGILDGSRNPTGGIAILNNEYWNNQATTTDTKTAITAQNLPKLGN